MLILNWAPSAKWKPEWTLGFVERNRRVLAHVKTQQGLHSGTGGREVGQLPYGELCLLSMVTLGSGPCLVTMTP